jgi:hypothetical protein
MSAIHVKYILAVGLLPLVLMSGCGYWAKETYLIGKPENSWRRPLLSGELVAHQCGKQNISVLPNVLESRTVEEDISYIPTTFSETIFKAKNDFEQYEVIFEFRPGGNTCTMDDISLNVQSEKYEPIASSRDDYPGAVTACHYRFNIPVGKLTAYTISFNNSSWGCQLPPLEMERKSGMYHHAPP